VNYFFGEVLKESTERKWLVILMAQNMSASHKYIFILRLWLILDAAIDKIARVAAWGLDIEKEEEKQIYMGKTFPGQGGKKRSNAFSLCPGHLCASKT
jgi:hypothetical protein